MSKTGILLVNLGTPDSPATADVRKYLVEFLNDKRVIDIPALQRKLLVNVIIAPTRAPKSAAQYKEVWTKEGSPLLLYGQKLKDKLQKQQLFSSLLQESEQGSGDSLTDALQHIFSQTFSEFSMQFLLLLDYLINQMNFQYDLSFLI